MQVFEQVGKIFTIGLFLQDRMQSLIELIGQFSHGLQIGQHQKLQQKAFPERIKLLLVLEYLIENEANLLEQDLEQKFLRILITNLIDLFAYILKPVLIRQDSLKIMEQTMNIVMQNFLQDIMLADTFIKRCV